MPELAEVELAKLITLTCQESTVSALQHEPKARIFREIDAHELNSFVGASLTGSQRHGKRLYLTFDDRNLEIHLGMSGRITLQDDDYRHQKHDHLILTFSNEKKIVLNDYRMFGKVTAHSEPAPWERLNPDPLARSFNQKRVSRIVEKHHNLKLKAALLRQDLFPGIGNWMADEICWRMQVSPTILLKFCDAQSLFEETKAVCKGAIKHVAQKNFTELNAKKAEKGFTAGKYVDHVPPKNWLFQHRWSKGGICPRCKNILDRETVAGRTTSFCRSCQPL